MSCSAVASAGLLWLAAATSNGAGPAPAPPPAALQQEPLFVDIVARAGRLKAEVAAFRNAAVSQGFKGEVAELSALDMKAHILLKERGTDGDLKCILKGISEDLPLKLKVLEDAATAPARETAVTDMAYLLNDNVEVITAPPAPPV